MSNLSTVQEQQVLSIIHSCGQLLDELMLHEVKMKQKLNSEPKISIHLESRTGLTQNSCDCFFNTILDPYLLCLQEPDCELVLLSLSNPCLEPLRFIILTSKYCDGLTGFIFTLSASSVALHPKRKPSPLGKSASWFRKSSKSWKKNWQCKLKLGILKSSNDYQIGYYHICHSHHHPDALPHFFKAVCLWIENQTP